MRLHAPALAAGSAATLLLLACNGNPVSPAAVMASSAATTTTSATVPAMYSQFGNGVHVSRDGSMFVLRTSDVPDGRSPYFGVGHPMYEAPHDGFQNNGHRIATQNITLRVRAAPATATPTDTPLAPIGVAVNSVVFFSQYAAQRQPLTFEIFSFDRYNGHPTPDDMYHYHVEPAWLTAVSRSRLVGVRLDGFAVYGPADAMGQVPGDLDACHGHTGVTPEFPEGIYHFHVTAEAPPSQAASAARAARWAKRSSCQAWREWRRWS